MITTKDLADNNTSISSTRWAFVTIIKFDIVTIALSLLVYIICHLVGKPLDLAFLEKEALLLGVLTTLVSVAKGAMGFEPHNYAKCDKPTNKREE